MQKIIWDKTEKNIIRKFEDQEENFQIIPNQNSKIKF